MDRTSMDMIMISEFCHGPLCELRISEISQNYHKIKDFKQPNNRVEFSE